MQHIAAAQSAQAALTASSGVSTGQLTVLLLSSSVLAAFLTQGAVWLRDWLAETKNGRFAALYLALALEEYVEACSDLIYDSDNWESSDGEFGQGWVNL